MILCFGVHHWAVVEYGNLMDYLPDDYLLILDESHLTVPQLHGMFRGEMARKDSLIDFGFRLPSARDNRPLNFAEFEAHVDQAVYVSATPGPYEREHSSQIVEQVIRPTGLVDCKRGRARKTRSETATCPAAAIGSGSWEQSDNCRQGIPRKAALLRPSPLR